MTTTTAKTPSPARHARNAPWLATAAVVGALTLAACSALLVDGWRSRAADPLASKDLVAMKAALRKNPGDETLRKEIQQLDFQLRSEYFRRQGRLEVGGWVVLGLGGVLLASLQVAIWWRRQVALPGEPTMHDRVRSGRLAQAAVAVLGLAVVAAGGALGWSSRNWSAPMPVAAVVPPTLPPVDTTAWSKNWPRFRGPDGSGVCNFANIPTDWDGATGRGVLWKTPVGLDGENSPIVWGNRVFLTGADKDRREVYCFDADGGKLLWTYSVANVPGSPAEPPDVQSPQPGYAAPTAACDGQRVYAIFANMDIVALTLDGKGVWKKNLGPVAIRYGYAASLAMAGQRLLVMLDQGGADDGKSKLLCLDGPTGRTLWQAARPVEMSWTTPIVIDAPSGQQILTSAHPLVMANRVDTGAEIWRADVMDGEVAPSPVFGDGLVIVVNQGARLAAIRPDGSGDVTKTHLAWAGRDDDNLALPDIASPLIDAKQRLVYLLDSAGLLTCIDAADGKKLWEKSLPGSFQSSPSLVGDRLMLLASNGIMHFITSGREFIELGKAGLGEPSSCSPAFADGRIFIRGKKHLFCMGAGK